MLAKQNFIQLHFWHEKNLFLSEVLKVFNKRSLACMAIIKAIQQLPKSRAKYQRNLRENQATSSQNTASTINRQIYQLADDHQKLNFSNNWEDYRNLNPVSSLCNHQIMSGWMSNIKLTIFSPFSTHFLSSLRWKPLALTIDNTDIYYNTL